jgi:salicylate hydroxylase
MKTAIIIGGGIAGFSAAIKLKEMGYRIILIEKEKLCTHLGGGIDIHPNGTKVLYSLGCKVEQKIKEYCRHNLSEIKIGTADGRTLNCVPLTVFEKNPSYPLISFFRQDLLKILKEDALIDEIYECKKCIELIVSDDFVEVKIEGMDQSLKADILIGADGINSVVRKKLNPHVDKAYLGHISFGGCVSRKYYRHNYIHGINRTCVVLPCTQNACHTVMFLPKPQGWLRKNAPNFEDKRALFLGWSTEVDTILLNLEEENRFIVESYEIPLLDFYADGRIFLVGDSAHAMSPLGALATTLALEDVDELTECLKATPSIHQAAKMYHVKRVPRVEEFRNFSKQFLIPSITQHSPEDYRQRMERIEETAPEKVFTALVNLTQSKVPEPQYASA